MILRHINDIASVCAGHGIKTAIISPGSRSAPITLAFNQHPELEVRVIADERSAAFIALGIAQQQKRPVVLVCTSGSAVYNYAPAIAEAYYQEIPLIVLSADRPPEWTNQYDGQTIQQSGIFGKHVKESFDFPVAFEHSEAFWHANRMINEAIIAASSFPKGPVHVNIPLREPFYPDENEELTFPDTRVIKNCLTEAKLLQQDLSDLVKEWENSPNRLIVIGQNERDESLLKAISSFSKKTGSLVINDIIGNQHQLENVIQHQDSFLQKSRFSELSDLVPDLLITVGKSLISKNLKLFLRDNPPKNHWQIRPSDRINDTLQHLTRAISISPTSFFSCLESELNHSTNDRFNTKWIELETKALKESKAFLETAPFGEFRASFHCLQSLPDNSQLHLANSMSVRYANLIGLSSSKNIEVFANRGTSGIDGSNSTAVGAALSQDKIITLLTGDMAFFYDRNAFWHGYDLANLRIIILNNHGGGIFRMIKGPQDQSDYEKLFETDQPLTAKNTSKDYDFAYQACTNQEELENALKHFYKQSNQAKVLEIFSQSLLNTRVFNDFKKLFLS